MSALTDLVGSPPANFGPFFQESIPNVNLQPEKSFGMDIGGDFRLQRNTVLSVDFYLATLHGQLYESTNLVDNNYQGTGEPLYALSYQNLGTSRYEGVLFDVRHDVPRGVYWKLSAGLTRGYVISVPPGFYNATGTTCNFVTTVGCTNLNVVPGINFNGTYNAGPGGSSGIASSVSVPYAQGLGLVGYRWAKEKYANLTATYFGNNNTYFQKAFVEFDAAAAYPITSSVYLTATLRNISGIYSSPFQIQSLGELHGVPAVAGSPFAEYGEQYGPRSLLVSANVKI